MNSGVTVLEADVGILLDYLPIKAANSLCIDVSNQVPYGLYKMQDQKSLMLC